MNKILKQILFWPPRIAGILFMLLLSIFAMDIFFMKLGFWGTIVGPFIHLIPSMLSAIAIALAQRWEWIGAVMFIGWAIWYIGTARGFEWFVYVMIAGIPALIGLLFLAGWIWRKQIRAG